MFYQQVEIICLNKDQKFSPSKPINNSAFSATPIGLSTTIDGQALGKRFVSPFTDGEIGRIISLKAVGFSTTVNSRMLSRNESTSHSFLKKWNSQGVFRGQVGRPKKDDRADEVIEPTIRLGDVSVVELIDNDLDGQSNSREVNGFEFFLSGID
jgi:hypothetical protein